MCKKCLKVLAVLVILCGILTVLCGCSPKVVTVPEVHNYYHHNTDSIIINDSVFDKQTTIIREVDSATMAQFGIQLKNQQSAWLIQQNQLMKEISELKQSKSDTVHIRDSIPVPYPIEKKLTLKDNIKFVWIGFLIAIILALIIFLFFQGKRLFYL
jgi:high-affinity K+ transport system ATPase subunit B